MERGAFQGDDMGYSLGQAAKVAGRSKTTIHRAINPGNCPPAWLARQHGW